MIDLKITPNYLGVNISGDFDDLLELSDSINNLSQFDNEKSNKFQTIQIILDSITSNIRQAILEQSLVLLKDNGIEGSYLESIRSDYPKKNVYYSFNISIIDILFLAVTGNKILFLSNGNICYKDSFLKFIKDSKVFESFIIRIWTLLNEEELKIDEIYSKALFNKDEYDYYLIQYIDKLFIDLYNESNRKEYINNTLLKLINKSQDYIDLYNELYQYSINENVDLFDATNSYLESYPEEFEW